jgi:hypothetical protein
MTPTRIVSMAALAAGCLLAGCGPGGPSTAMTAGPGAVVQNPDAVSHLQRWEDALAAAPEGAIIPVAGANLMENSVGDPATFVTPLGLNGVIAIPPEAAGLPMPVDPGGLPTLGAGEAARAAWQPSGEDAANGTATLLRPRSETLSMLTTNGARVVPVWRFDVESSTVTVTALAIDAAYLVTPNGMPEATPSSTDIAQQLDDRTISVTIAGAADGCGQEDRPHVSEGTQAIAMFVETVTSSADGPCTANTVYRTVPLTLERPIGDRILIGVDGGAMYIEPLE